MSLQVNQAKNKNKTRKNSENLIAKKKKEENSNERPE